MTLAIGQVRPEVQKLLDVTSETLNLAIRAMGRCKTWLEVASLMERFVKSQGMYVVEKFVGHGIGQTMHEDPQVPNFASAALRSTTSSSSRASCWRSSPWSRWARRKFGPYPTAGRSRPRIAVQRSLRAHGGHDSGRTSRADLSRGLTATESGEA